MTSLSEPEYRRRFTSGANASDLLGLIVDPGGAICQPLSSEIVGQLENQAQLDEEFVESVEWKDLCSKR